MGERDHRDDGEPDDGTPGRLTAGSAEPATEALARAAFHAADPSDSRVSQMKLSFEADRAVRPRNAALPGEPASSDEHAQSVLRPLRCPAVRRTRSCTICESLGHVSCVLVKRAGNPPAAHPVSLRASCGSLVEIRIGRVRVQSRHATGHSPPRLPHELAELTSRTAVSVDPFRPRWVGVGIDQCVHRSSTYRPESTTVVLPCRRRSSSSLPSAMADVRRR